MADTTFCNPDQINDSREQNQFPVQNVFKDSGLPPHHPTQLTPTRPKTAQDMNEAEVSADNNNNLDGRKTQMAAGRQLKLRSQSSQISDNAANRLNHLNNVEYLGSDDSASTPPKKPERMEIMFTRGAYLDEMNKQNNVLKQKGIKIENLNIKIPNNDQITYPWQNDFKKTALLPPERKVQPLPYRVPAQSNIGELDYLGGKMGGTMNQSFQMMPPMKQDFANLTGGYNTFQRATQQFGQTFQNDNLQNDIMRVDPFYQTQQRNMNNSMMPFNSVLDDPTTKPDYSFSLKDIMQKSMQLAKVTLQTPSPYQQQNQYQYQQQIPQMNQSFHQQSFYQSQPQQQPTRMNQSFQQMPYYSQEMYQSAAQSLQHLRQSGGGFERLKVYPPSAVQQEQQQRDDMYNSPYDVMPQIQMMRQSQTASKMSSHIRSLSVSKQQRQRRMEELKINIAVLRA